MGVAEAVQQLFHALETKSDGIVGVASLPLIVDEVEDIIQGVLITAH
jgi:hypothetical protein